MDCADVSEELRVETRLKLGGGQVIRERYFRVRSFSFSDIISQEKFPSFPKCFVRPLGPSPQAGAGGDLSILAPPPWDAPPQLW